MKTRNQENGYACYKCKRPIDGLEPGFARLCRYCAVGRSAKVGNQLGLFGDDDPYAPAAIEREAKLVHAGR
jgi:hypothetical protein